MPKQTDISLCEVTSSTDPIRLRTPIKFGGRVMTEIVLLNVTMEAETRDGRRGRGFGSMPMGNVWAWPSQQVSAERTLAAMIELGQRLASDANHHLGIGHPLEITHDLSQSFDTVAAEVTRAAGLAEPMVRLAQLVAASPLEAAIYDAYGKALGQNSYNLLGPEFVGHDLSTYLSTDFAGEYLDRYTLREPKPQMPLYHLIGALDPLSKTDLSTPIGDGLPETLSEWIAFNGLTHLKIKLAGDDLHWDVDRVISVERVAAEAQAARLHGMALFSRFQRKVCERRVRARFPGEGRRTFARSPRAAPVHRTANAS